MFKTTLAAACLVSFLCTTTRADAATIPPVAWSGDGKKIAVAGRLTSGHGIYIFSTEGRQSSYIPFQYPVVAIKWPSMQGPISLLAKHTNGRHYLWRANPSGIISRLSSKAVYIHDSRSANLFACSPDGRSVAFPSSVNGNVDIWKVNVENGRELRLTSWRGKDFDPAWSPDGEVLAFTSDRGGTLGIWMVSADGGSEQKVADSDADEQHASWSPDSNELAFLCTGSRNCIYVTSLPDHALRPVAVGGRNYLSPVWSGTGRWIAFSYGHSPTNIFTTPARQTQGHGPYYQATFDRGNGISTDLRVAAWSPIRDQLAFSTYEGGRLSVRIATLSEKLGPALKNLYTAPRAQPKRKQSLTDSRRTPTRRRT